jgi:hypothetical protein
MFKGFSFDFCIFEQPPHVPKLKSMEDSSNFEDIGQQAPYPPYVPGKNDKAGWDASF